MLVFHLDDDLLFGLEGHRAIRGEGAAANAAKYWNDGAYRLVAHVRCDEVDDAFRLTNHIDTEWQKNVGVSPASGRMRSSSVGDIVVDNEGNAHLCMSCGWETVQEIGKV